MSKITSCIFTSTILVCVLLLVSCNLNNTVSAQLTVSSGNESNFSRVIEDHNSVCSVDGLRLWIKSIHVTTRDYAEDNNFKIWESTNSNGTMVDLRSTVDIATITSQVDLPIITIHGIQAMLGDLCEIKAYTYLSSNSTYYYTSSNGIHSTASFDPNNPPADYAFKSYSFLHPRHPDQDYETSEAVDYPEGITIIEGESYNFEIYIDLIDSVRFWDGNPDYRYEPFVGWTDEFYPDNIPDFGIIQLPWCLVAYNTAEYSNPALETYLISQNTSYFDTPNLVTDYLGTLSFVFLSENSFAPVFGSIRGNFSILNFSSTHQEWYADFEGNGSNIFSFNSYSLEWLQNNFNSQYLLATYNNFPHLSVGQTDSFTITKIGGSTDTWYAKRIK